MFDFKTQKYRLVIDIFCKLIVFYILSKKVNN